MSKKRDTIISNIASKELFIDTLETRNMDSLDFHEVSVSSIKDALVAAFEAGKKSARQ